MVNESSKISEAGDLEGNIARHMEEFGFPASGNSKMLKSIMYHYPEAELGAIRVMRELNLTHALLMASADVYLRPAGLSWSKLFLLLWLRAMQEEGKQGLNPSELSDHLAVTRNTISTLLSGLERQSYIRRELDAEDKRRFVIRLTPAGSEIVQRCSTPLFSHLQKLFSSINREQCVMLVQLLTQVQQAIVQERPALAARCPYSLLHTDEE